MQNEKENGHSKNMNKEKSGEVYEHFHVFME